MWKLLEIMIQLKSKANFSFILVKSELWPFSFLEFKNLFALIKEENPKFGPEVATVGDYKGASPDKMMDYIPNNTTTSAQVLKNNTKHIHTHVLIPLSLSRYIDHMYNV